MRLIFALAAAFALLLSPAGPSAAPANAAVQTEDAQTVVVHLSQFTNDLHAAFMALNIATILQETGAAQVTLFLDLEGVRLADMRSRGDLAWGDMESIGDTFDGFVAAGGGVVVCPHCAALAGVDADQLREGAVMGTREQIGEMLLAADKIIDY